MANTQTGGEAGAQGQENVAADMKLEVVVIPVSNIDRAVEFYKRLGWRLDVDITSGARRIVHFTPQGSSCSILFGANVTPSTPGSAQLLHLVVSDIATARDAIARRGVEISEVFHDAQGGFNRFDLDARESGLDPERRSYASFASFKDPDGNGWVLQEVTARLPGRIDSNVTSFTSAADLASAMRRAAAAHGEHEKRTGAADPNWPDWYAAFIVAEQSGKPLAS